MTKTPAVLALTGCMLLLLLFVQLQTSFDIQDASWSRLQGVFHAFIPLDLRQAPSGPSSDYVLGVGKSDITGYAGRDDMCRQR